MRDNSKNGVVCRWPACLDSKQKQEVLDDVVRASSITRMARMARCCPRYKNEEQ